MSRLSGAVRTRPQNTTVIGAPSTVCCQSIHRSIPARACSDSGHIGVPAACPAARYRRIALLSHSTNPSSTSVGTIPLGFIARYSTVSVPPNAPPTSSRW